MKLSVIFAELASHGSEALTDGPRIVVVHPDFTTTVKPAAPSPDALSTESVSPAPNSESPRHIDATVVGPVLLLGHPADSASHEAKAHPVPLRKIRSDISIGDIVTQTQRAGFGFIMAFIAIVSIPFVGMSMPFGLAITGLAWQLLLGRKEPWLPRRVRDHLVSIRTIDIIANRIARVTKGMEKVFRPRLTFLTSGIMVRVLALCVLAQAIGLAAPLPIPGSNWFFILPIVVYSVALMEEDGLLVLVGHVLQLLQVVVVWAFWHVLEKPIIGLWHLVRGWFGN